MTRLRVYLYAVMAAAVVLAACRRQQAIEPAPPPPTPARVDTLIVTREVAPALPEGVPQTICLSTGFPMPVMVAANGDTLIGERRVPLRELRPGLVFEGVYAEGKVWLDKGTPITFEKRSYRKTGDVVALACDDLKLIGEHDGVPLFAQLTAPSPLEAFFVPVHPGRFQAYRTTLPRRQE